MSNRKRTTLEEAQRVGDAIGVNWESIELDQFRRGMEVELKHGTQDPETNVTNDDPIVNGKIALAHLREFPDYYDRLQRMEDEATADWAERNEDEAGFQHDL